MNDTPRENLEESDRKWEYIYDTFPDLRLPQGETIFRVHHGGCDEPELSDYEDNGKNQQNDSTQLMTGGKGNGIVPKFALTGTGYHSRKTLWYSAQIIFKAKVWEGLS